MFGEINIANIVRELERHNMLPAIVFRTSRSQCDLDARQASSNRALRLSRPDQNNLRAAIREIVARYEMDEALISSHPQYGALITAAIGAHHAGQLLMWRLLLEELMVQNLLRVLVATGTVAAGVDFPARTVVITAHSRRGSEGFMDITSAEFQQMSGRAGRRGKDTVGFCIAAPSRFCDAREVLAISRRPPEPLRSSYYPSPSTVLNLLRYRNVDDLRYTVARSLASFIDKREADELERLADEREAKNFLGEDVEAKTPAQRNAQREIKRYRKKARQYREKQTSLLEKTLKGLETLGYLEGVSLSEKGYWAANLCTSLVLELGEMIEIGLFKDASLERVAALVASVCGDPHRKYLETKEEQLTNDDVSTIEGIISRVGSLEIPGVFAEREVLRPGADTVLTWMQAESWQEFRSLLLLARIAEGDAARLITQTADHLNQLMRLSHSHPELALRAEEAKFRILRPPLTEVINVDEL